MTIEQYHEPVGELAQETRTFARIIHSLVEEAEAIDMYEQRMDVEGDEEARGIIRHAQIEEMEHFAMDLEFLIRQKPEWKTILKGVLFIEGDIVENAEKAEKEITSE